MKLAAALFALALPALASPPPLEEKVMRVPVGKGAEAVDIVVTVYRPPGAGPFPLAVLSHGSPRTPEDRRREARQRLVSQSRPFLDMGFAVVVPTRRGFGESGGTFAENFGPCSNPDYYSAGLEAARDIRAAVDAVRGETWADAQHVVLVGQSAGGFGSVAASATKFDGLVGVINFAGGRGSLRPDFVCTEWRLVEAMSRYGKAARVPELWIYSVNDHYFNPALARRMHKAFVDAGGTAEFIEAPATGADGHLYFGRGVEDWSPRVESFLKRIGAKR